ncbi:hypothetical protein, partial [Candidatus Raskinella chloraquaticus]|uniref:hypothetical protein n=1 Tax=Candidatus Raskinella chloraquaticus TaxID=1951219 RepID=UPI003672CCF0
PVRPIHHGGNGETPRTEIPSFFFVFGIMHRGALSLSRLMDCHSGSFQDRFTGLAASSLMAL